MKYLFFLGRKTELVRCELEYLLSRIAPDASMHELIEGVVLCEGDNLSLETLQEESGGIIKIAQVIEEQEKGEVTLEQLVELLARESGEQKKFTFSISEFGAQAKSDYDLPEMKTALKDKGYSVRYLETEKQGLSSAQLSHHKILELVIVHGEKTYYAVTRTVQNIDAWSDRDFGKPFRDARKGMLPPKVARMMINLAIGKEKIEDALLYDPFCGSGTVLLEANLMGIHGVGSDISKDSIAGAEKNISWFKTTHDVPAFSTVFVGDATHVDPRMFSKRIQYIVTEPFLGKPNPKEGDAERVLKGLYKLYLGAFKAWRSILTNDARIVMIFPQLKFGENVKTMSGIIDTIETLGYTREKGPLVYDRPQTIVQRAIYIFKYKAK